MTTMDNSTAIGIDLGTTNSCVAYYHDGKLEILENSDGDRITSSNVYFINQNKVVVGKFAKSMTNNKPENGVYEIKRLIGRRYNDPVVQKSLQHLTYNVKNKNNDPIVIIKHPNSVNKNSLTIELMRKTPMDLSAAILSKIRKDVEVKLGHRVTRAVVTVPAYFNVSQREATLEAAQKAGLTVLKLLNEPTAAALSYFFKKKCDGESHYLVYDLGGGTLDVSLLKRSKDSIEIVAVDGDSNLGGKDFDNLIMNHVCEELKRKHKYDPRENPRAKRRVQNKCEDAKKELSSVTETVIYFESFVEGKDDVTVSITRKQFERMAQNLFQKTIEILDGCLKSANVAQSEIQEVILSGGSTRIPRIQNMISTYFGGRKLNKFLNPEECVAEGAGLQAALLSNNLNQAVQDFDVKDVTPQSLGLKMVGGLMEVVIQRNAPIPTIGTSQVSNTYNNQTLVDFDVYEGERLKAEMNRYLGSFTMKITPAPPGQCQITLKMSIDRNGILTVTAVEELGNNIKDLKVVYSRGSRSNEEGKSTLEGAKSHEKEDEYFRQFAYRYQYIIDYCEFVKYNIVEKNLRTCLDHIYKLCVELEKKVEELDDRKDLKKMELLMKEMERRCNSYVQKYDFTEMPNIEEFLDSIK